MNILLVSQMTLNSTTGVTTYYLSLKDNYIKLGHNVTLITTDETPKLISFILKILWRLTIIFNFRFFKLLMTEFIYFVSIYFAVKKYKKKQNWHIIHGQDPSSSYAAKVAVKGKIPIVTTCHFNDNPVQERQIAYKLSSKQVQKVSRWVEFLFSNVDNYIFVSRYTYEKSSFLFKNKINFRIINNGVKFYPKKELCNNSDCLIISNVGTIEDRKNQLLLINSASLLAERELKFKINFFGEGPRRIEWEKQVKKSGLNNYIFFWGYSKNIIEALNKSDLYIHTAKNEAFCLSITEALSIGLPVLALANGGISEQFPPSKNGLLNPDITPSQLASEIVSCYNLEKRKQLQNEQYTFSCSKFTVEQMTNKILDFYNSIIVNK